MGTSRLTFGVAAPGAALAIGVTALVLVLAADLSEAQSGTMHNCPPVAKWAIAVWDGESGTAADDALTTCGSYAVSAAYSLDPQTGAWSRWFAGKPDVSNLPPLNDMQGVLALGAAPTPIVTPTPTTPPSSVCNGLLTYSEVVATYPPGVELTISKFDIVAVINGAWLTEGVIEARGGEDLVQWYGVQITIKTSTPITIDGVTYQPGDKLTVDKDLNYVTVCSWY